MGNYKLVSFILISEKVMEQILLKTISSSPENTWKTRWFVESGQHGFTMEKSCLTNSIAFCNEKMESADKGRAEVVICLIFGKAFNTGSH